MENLSNMIRIVFSALISDFCIAIDFFIYLVTPIVIPRAVPRCQSLLSLSEINVSTIQKVQFKSAITAYMVQDLEKNLYSCTYPKLRIIGFKLQSSCKYVLRVCMVLVIFFLRSHIKTGCKCCFF